MNFIKEPKGVDFIIQSPPLTAQEKIEISEYIAATKAKKSNQSKITKPKVVVKTK